MDIQKIRRKKYNSSFLNSVQLVIAFPAYEYTATTQTSVVELLVKNKFIPNNINELEKVIRAKRDNTILILSNNTILMIVDAQDYRSFENYTNSIALIKDLLKLMNIDEISTLLFQKRNTYPFTKTAFKTEPSKEDIFNSVFSKDFMKEQDTMILSESSAQAFLAQRRFSKTDEYFLAESIVSATQMNAIKILELDSVLEKMNDELFSIWNAITSENVKKIMEGNKL